MEAVARVTDSAFPNPFRLEFDYISKGRARKMAITIPEAVALKIFEATVLIGTDAALQLGNLGAFVSYFIDHEDDPTPETGYTVVATDIARGLAEAFLTIENHYFGRRWNTPEDRALALTYRQLQSGGGRSGGTGWEDAAQLASRALKRDIKTDTFRKWMHRWAKENGLPKVKIYQRSIETEQTS